MSAPFAVAESGQVMAGEQILVVEDQRAVAGALQMRLRGLGYDVSAIARDGMEAIQKAAELHPDLILMDIKLGDGMDGIQAAEEILTQFDIPVIYVSAYVDKALLDRARPTRPAGFINKPFTTKDLLTTIDLALSNRRNSLFVADPAADTGSEQKDAVVTTDIDGLISYISPLAERRIGLRRNQVVGRRLDDIMPGLYALEASDTKDMVERVLKQGAEEFLLRDGGSSSTGLMEDHLTPLRDAEGKTFGAALKFSAPATKPARSDHAMALEKAIDALSVGIILIDDKMCVHHMNEYAREIINHNKGLDYTSDRLSARDRHINEKLQQLVHAAVEKVRLGIEDGSDAMFIKAPMIRDQVEIIATPVPAKGQHHERHDYYPLPVRREYGAPRLTRCTDPALRPDPDRSAAGAIANRR